MKSDTANPLRPFRPILRSLIFLLALFWLALTFSIIDIRPLAGSLRAAGDDWGTIYAHLAEHAREGLVITVVVLGVIDVLFNWWKSIFLRFLGLDMRVFLILTGILVLTTRVGWTLISGSVPWADAEWYHERAVGLSQGLGYLNAQGMPTAYWPPGYPVFLSLMYRIAGPEVMFGQIANVALSLAQTFLLYLVARRMSSEKSARTSALVLVLSIGTIAYTGLLMSELLGATMFLAILYCWLSAGGSAARPVALVGVGILAGVGALIRPVMLVVPVAVILVMLIDRRRIGNVAMRSGLLLAGVVIALVPNIVRNYQAFDAIVPISTNGGINLWIGNNPDASGAYMTPPPLPLTGNEAEQSRIAARAGFEWIISHPGAALLGAVKKSFHLYYRDDQGIFFTLVRAPAETYWPAFVALIILANLTYYSVFVLAICRIWRMRDSIIAERGILVITLVLFTVFYLIYFGADRFHMPIWPVFTFFAAEWVMAGNHLSEPEHGVTYVK